MKIAVLTANLGNFDTPVDPVRQTHSKGWEMDVTFHRFTDENFPPIAGMTPRMQYRLAKLFGWELFPGHDIYIWLDGSVSLQRPDSVEWFLGQLEGADAAFFRHPQRDTIKAESDHIEEKLQQKHWYIVPRYENGLHKEMVEKAYRNPTFKDNVLYTSTAFIYRNNVAVHEMMRQWWFYQSRYYTCDQIALPYAIHKARMREGIRVNKIPDNQYKIGYLSLVSHHK